MIDFEVISYDYSVSGVINIICNREPTPEEEGNLLEGLPLGCEINCIYPNEDDKDEVLTFPECCGKIMKTSTATRDPFNGAINLNVGKPWCSVCGKYGS